MNSTDKELVKNEIQSGLEQVDSTLRITEFECSVDRVNRRLKVTCTATNADNEAVSLTASY